MFGVLKPILCGVSAQCKDSYNLTYCNLCAALSASGIGILNRPFLVNDIVTIDWLLRADRDTSGHAFKCYNCAKGGIVGRKKLVSLHQKFLAAVSSYVCGVKLQDNALDSPKLKNKSMVLAYKPIMQKAEAFLTQLNLLDKFKEYQQADRGNELNKIANLQQASLPTERCYELFTLENSKYLTNLPTNILSLLGRYLGRCVYLLDAIADMDKDRKTNQYNVLNMQLAQNNGAYDKAQVVGLCLDYLKPMRHKLAKSLDELSEDFNVELIKSRWNSLFNSIEKQLFKLVKPLNSEKLFKSMATFNPITSCTKCSSWSSAYICCCDCCCCSEMCGCLAGCLTECCSLACCGCGP